MSPTGAESQSTHVLFALMDFVLNRTRKTTAATRCMCPLYDSNRQAWIELQAMSVARIGHGVVAAGQSTRRPHVLNQVEPRCFLFS